MNCTDARLRMMDRLYETLPLQESIALETHLLSCADCSREWGAVRHSHTHMRRLPMEVPSASIQSAVLALKFDPIPQTHFGSIWKHTAYAAVFMALLFSSLHFLNPNLITINKAEPNHNPISFNSNDTHLSSNTLDPIYPTQVIATAPVSSQIEQENSDEQIITESRTVNLSAVPHPESQSSSQFAAYEKKSAKTSENDAEEAFRSGLKNYNEAFTHVGDEKESLLRSAIVFLQKMEQKYPDQKQWLAMSLILIADAHRELGESPKAIDAYRRMIEHFPDLEPYCKEARSSMFQLCINPGDDLPQAESLLTDYEKHYPKTPEFAELSLAYAEKIQDEKPKEALSWANKAAESLPEGHPLEAKTFTLMDELEVKVADQFTIKDWFFLGPLSILAQPYQGNEQYLPPNQRQSFTGINGKISWIRPYPNKTGPLNINETIPNLKKDTCAFVVTYIHSPQTRLVYVPIPHFKSRVWINESPIWAGDFVPRNQSGTTTVTLNEGWNEVLIKWFITENQPVQDLKFVLYSEQGGLLTDLTVDPAQGGRNKDEKKAVLRRR